MGQPNYTNGFNVNVNHAFELLTGIKKKYVIGKRLSELPPELQPIIQRCLDRLTPDHRTVVILRHFEDLSYEEIGETLGLPVKTVKSRLFSARVKLRDLLIQQGLGQE